MSSQNIAVGIESQVNPPQGFSALPDLLGPLTASALTQFQSLQSQVSNGLDVVQSQLANGGTQLISTLGELGVPSTVTGALSSGQASLMQGLASLQDQAAALPNLLDALAHTQPSDLSAIGTVVTNGLGALTSTLSQAQLNTGFDLQGTLGEHPGASLFSLLSETTGHQLDPATNVVQSLLETVGGAGLSMGKTLDGGQLASLISSLSGDLSATATQIAGGNFGANWAEVSAPLPDLLSSLLSGTTGSASLGGQQAGLGDVLTPLNGLVGAYTGADAPLQGHLQLNGGPLAAPIHSLLDSVMGLQSQLPSISSVAHSGSAPALPAGLGNLLNL